MGGLTGVFAVPAVPYLQTLGFNRDQLVQAMGIWFTAATIALAAGLGGRQLIPPGEALLSVVAILPALIGMRFGQAVRQRIPEALFRKVLLSALLLLGFSLALRVVLSWVG